MAEREAGPFALAFWGAVVCLVIAAAWGVTRMASRARDEARPTDRASPSSTGVSHEGEDAGASGAAPGARAPSGGGTGEPPPGTGATTVPGGNEPTGTGEPPPGTGATTVPGGNEPTATSASGSEPSAATTASAPPAGPTGTLPAEVIRDTVREAIPFIRFCFEWQLERHPELEGRVTMRWTIRPDGTVEGADVLEDALGDDTVLRCFRGVVGRLHFPPPEGGGPVTVHYPFVLAGSPEARRPEGI